MAITYSTQALPPLTNTLKSTCGITVKSQRHGMKKKKKKAQPYLKLIHESSHVFKDSGRERGKKENDKKKKKKYCQVQSVQRSRGR